MTSGAGKIWGYARVSTEEQELGMQITALRAVGVPDGNIVEERASGKAGSDRPRYAKLLASLDTGDRLVVWKLDRLGRSTTEVLNVMDDLTARGVVVVVTTIGLDIGTPTGKMMLTMLAAVAKFERDLIREARYRWHGGREEARSSYRPPPYAPPASEG
jgi:DNA invertase Pin-like site-specific DNA recombinase